MSETGTGLELLIKRIDSEERSNIFIDWVLNHDIFLKKRKFSFTGFEELKDIYLDMHPRKVIRKGVQIGLTTWAVLYKLWKMKIARLKGIYYAPSKDFFKKFTPDRVDTILKYFPEISLSINGIYLKECGGGSIYFCGLNTRTDVASVDADTLIFDEFDISNQELATEAKDRLMRSSCPELHMLSKPTVPGYGIDLEFKKSDQHFRLMKCPKCNHWNDVIEHFPKNLFPKRGKGGYLGCIKCKAKLDPKKAKWVAKQPKNKEIRGYHLSQLYWTWIPPDYKDAGDKAFQMLNSVDDSVDKKRVYQSVAGLPFAGAMEPITDQVLNNVHGAHDMIPFAGHSYLGFDQGDNIHIVIGHTEGELLVVHWIETTRKFSRVHELMSLHNVWCAVGDALPNKHSSKDWAFEFKGYAYIQYFLKEESGTIKRGEEYKDEEGDEEKKVLTVSVNRTESLDTTVEGFQKAKIILPRRYCSPEMEVYREHLKNLQKEETINKKGQKKVQYKFGVPNHYGMATNSMRIASKLLVVKPFGLQLYAAGGSFYVY
jgi:hypothetical protein